MKILNIIKTFGAVFALIFALGSITLNTTNAQVWCNDGSYAAYPEACGGGNVQPSWNQPCYGYDCMNTGVWCNDGSYAAYPEACPQHNYNQGVWCNDGSYAAYPEACPQHNYNQGVWCNDGSYAAHAGACPSTGGSTYYPNYYTPTVTCPDGSLPDWNGNCPTGSTYYPNYYPNYYTPSIICPDGSVVNYQWQCPVYYSQPNFNYPIYQPPIVYPPTIIDPMPPVTPVNPTYQCWDGSVVYNLSLCPAQYQTCWDGSKIPVNQTCPSQYKNCPDGSVVLTTQQCPSLPQITCWDGSKVYNSAYCPVQYKTCWDGSKVTDLSQCPTQYKTCSDGSKVLISQECPQYQTCWDGSRVLVGQVCPTQYQTCWDGSKIPVSQTCPAQYQTCWDGSKIPVSQTCPSQYKNCPDGSVVLTTQQCPTQYQTCWDGSRIPVNQVCPIRTQTCPNGQVIPITQTCPTQTQTCWNGLVIPVFQTCPAQYQTCWDGSIVPVNQSCPSKTQTTVIVKKVEVREHTVITNLATKVTKNSAQCNAVGLIVDGVSSVGWFEYGETVDVNKNTNSASIGGAPEASFSNIITGLKPNTTYYCRAVMANKDGTYKGKVVSFKTLGDTKITYPAPKAPTKQAPKTKTEFVCADGSIAVARTVLVGETINAGGKLLKVNIERNVPELIQGNVLNYRVTVENISDIAVSGVEIKIVLPGEMSFVDVVTTGGVMVQDNIMTIPLNSINAEEVKTLIIPVKVSSEALVGKTVVSTVYVSYNLPVEGSQIVRDEVSAYMIADIVGVDGKGVSSSKSFISKIFPQTLLGWLVFFAVILILVVLIMNILRWVADRKKEKEEEVIHHHIS